MFLKNQLLQVVEQSRIPTVTVLDEMAKFMKGQFNPVCYIIRKRFKFWSAVDRKPGKPVLDIAAPIHHDTVKCDFPSICDPQDEAMRTRFMCSVNNVAVLKALFKHKEGDLTFTKEVAAAVEMEKAAKVAKRRFMVWCRIPFIGLRH